MTDEDSTPRRSGFNHQRVLVVHVQRTGGTSLRRMLEGLGSNVVYPSSHQLNTNEGRRYSTPQQLLRDWRDLPPYRFLFTHCVASLAEMLPVPHARVAFLRDPIERSISITQLHATNTGRSVSELVSDRDFLRTHINDLQTRIFGLNHRFSHLRPQETPPATDSMVGSAIERLRTFDFIGITESFSSHLQRFDDSFGTRTASSVFHDNRSCAGDVPRDDLLEIFKPLVERDQEMFEVTRREGLA